jgi:hypothetical protein
VLAALAAGTWVLIAPITASIGLLLLRPIIDCFWSQKFIELGAVQLNLQSAIGITVPAASFVAVIWNRSIRFEGLLEWVLAAFVGISFVGVIVGPGLVQSFGDFGRVALPIAFFWVGRRIGAEARYLPTTIWVLALYGVLPFVSAVLQLVGAIKPLAGAVGSPIDVLRVTGFYHHPLDIAMRAGIAAPYAIALATIVPGRLERGFLRCWAAALGIVACATLVRSALVATVSEFIAYAAMLRRRGLALIILLTAFGAALAVAPVREVIVSAARPIREGAIYQFGTGRALLFAAQVAAFNDATPLRKMVGRGLHSTPAVNLNYSPIVAADPGLYQLEEGNVGAHNQYLRVLTESGIVGLLLLVVILSSAGLSCRAVLQHCASPIDRAMASATLVMLIAVGIYGLSATPLDSPFIAWPVWLSVGIVRGIQLTRATDNRRAAGG